MASERDPSPRVSPLRSAPFALRDARGEDIPLMRALLAAAWSDAYGETIGAAALATMTRDALSDDALARGLGEPGVCTLVAMRDAAMLGLAASRVQPSSQHVMRLYVAAAAQGQGLGGALLGALRARRPDADLTLHVEAGNATARGFYAAHGFLDEGPARETVAGVAFDVRALRLPAGAVMGPPSRASRNDAR